MTTEEIKEEIMEEFDRKFVIVRDRWQKPSIWVVEEKAEKIRSWLSKKLDQIQTTKR